MTDNNKGIKIQTVVD